LDVLYMFKNPWYMSLLLPETWGAFEMALICVCLFGTSRFQHAVSFSFV
jgi:hypothetical protein